MNIPQSKNARIRAEAGATNPPVKLTGIPIISPLPYVQEHYETCRRNGCNHNLAEMLAFKTAPASRTDDDFFRGVGTLDKQLGDDDGHYQAQVLANYAKATGGGRPNENYVYNAGLAEFPGDPRAFLDSAGSAKRLAEERNVSISGFVNHKASEPISDPFATASPMTGRNKIAPDLKNMIKEAAKSKGQILSDAAIEAKHGNHTKGK